MDARSRKLNLRTDLALAGQTDSQTLASLLARARRVVTKSHLNATVRAVIQEPFTQAKKLEGFR